MRDPIEFNDELNRYDHDASYKVAADVHILASVVESLAAYWRNETTSRHIENELGELQDSCVKLMLMVDNAMESMKHAK